MTSATLSSHVLDTSVGRPAAGLRLTLFSGAGEVLASDVTDTDGRAGSLGGDLPQGTYVLHFDTASYFQTLGVEGFYPEVTISFLVGEDEHYHVPLLLNPFGYSTYRGS
jgi:5-hydroxyisourate hydrolase